ncbi:MAG TPA: hypothetical protein DEP84_14365 [Chloroflexi bacterium]|nr:hypothetical protein [Chloroflexota bacterium]
MPENTEPIGEIIETATQDFLAESLTLHQPPLLGELVKVQVNREDYCYAVVSYASTSSPDAGRRAVRRSSESVVDEAVYASHPQLNRLLQTTFRAILTGWSDAGVSSAAIRQSLPPTPPPLHHSTYRCTPEAVRRFTDQLLYFRLILACVREVPTEQVLAGHIRYVYALRGNDEPWLSRAAQEVASLLKNDHERLLTLLYAIDPQH